jgi:ADP-heptose:LPS heptosyltransferase
VNRYLIFRTDRVGDFLISAILLKCIKKNDPFAHITLIASNKNFSYIKTFPYVDSVIQLNNNFLSKIITVFKLFKYKYQNIIIHDNKNRSKFISFFLKSNKKIKIKNETEITHIEIIKDILKRMKFNYFDEALNTLDHHKKNNANDKGSIQLHFDEKWIFNDYIKKFIRIEPTEIELINFIKMIIKKSGKKIIITTGIRLPKIMQKIKPILKELEIEIYEDLNFSLLEKITSKSSILISCHGAISHVATANNIRQIDIIDKSYDYGKWTCHFRNYKPLYRDSFNFLSNKIVELI